MENLAIISQLDLYYLVRDAIPAIVKEEALLDPLLRPAHGVGWARSLEANGIAYRTAVDTVFREAAETTAATGVLHQMFQDVGDWRELAVSLARNAPAAQRDVLLQAAGWGLGKADSPKEMKDLLMTLKSRVAVHATSFLAQGMEPELVELPARVFAALEGGGGDVAREKAEDGLARSEVRKFYDTLIPVLSTAWRSAELLPVQARLVARKAGAAPELVAEHNARAQKAAALDELLEKLYGEARIQAKKRAATEPVPPGLADADEEPVPEEEKPAA